MRLLTILLALILYSFSFGGVVSESVINSAIQSLVDKNGVESQTRIEIGVKQAAAYWQEKDGSEKEFSAFCDQNFINDPEQLKLTFERFERDFEIIYGHNHEINRDLSMPMQLEMNPLLPVDYLFAEYDPFAHIQDDMFKTKIAFVVLLNFPEFALQEKLKQGSSWTREQWAYARLGDSYSARVPAHVSQNLAKVYVQADDYIANYNIHMYHLLNGEGERLFPKDLNLITHWGLRDELKSHYANMDGLSKQKMIHAVMQRIITQDIPEMVIDSDDVDWNPIDNTVFRAGEKMDAEPEDNARYQRLLNVFHAEQKLDKYWPTLPTKMDRRFLRDREISEKEFEALVTTVLADPTAKQIADLISKRLGRKLQPFDIWYNGFKPRGDINEAELDKIVGERYPTVAAFQNDLPNILTKLGFTQENADWLQTKITVDPSRGAGHASGALRREDNAHLRTRIPDGGMKYKGFNIAIHELGHNVEQVFSLNGMDHYMLNGVPNTAFTEAFAFVFQSRDLDVLGMHKATPEDEHLKALDAYWSTCEIASVGLVDIRVWRWMYEHPKATAAELKTAVIQIAKDVWNEYYAPITGIKDSMILGIYSHMVVYGLYLPDYSLGHLIMFQIEHFLKDKNLGVEMERMCKLGRLTPDAWMRAAVGAPVSGLPMVEAAKKALQVVN
jgi:hypothetical protein